MLPGMASVRTALRKAWQESLHPRAKGRFTFKGQGSPSSGSAVRATSAAAGAAKVPMRRPPLDVRLKNKGEYGPGKFKTHKDAKAASEAAYRAAGLDPKKAGARDKTESAHPEDLKPGDSVAPPGQNVSWNVLRVEKDSLGGHVVHHGGGSFRVPGAATGATGAGKVTRFHFEPKVPRGKQPPRSDPTPPGAPRVATRAPVRAATVPMRRPPLDVRLKNKPKIDTTRHTPRKPKQGMARIREIKPGEAKAAGLSHDSTTAERAAAARRRGDIVGANALDAKAKREQAAVDRKVRQASRQAKAKPTPPGAPRVATRAPVRGSNLTPGTGPTAAQSQRLAAAHDVLSDPQATAARKAAATRDIAKVNAAVAGKRPAGGSSTGVQKSSTGPQKSSTAPRANRGYTAADLRKQSERAATQAQQSRAAAKEFPSAQAPQTARAERRAAAARALQLAAERRGRVSAADKAAKKEAEAARRIRAAQAAKPRSAREASAARIERHAIATARGRRLRG